MTAPERIRIELERDVVEDLQKAVAHYKIAAKTAMYRAYAAGIWPDKTEAERIERSMDAIAAQLKEQTDEQ